MIRTNKKINMLNLIRKVSVIAVPIALQNLLASTGSMVDTMMIGSLGETEVAAVGLCAQFSTLLFSSYWGFAGGGILFISQYWGIKDKKGINRSYGLMISCMMLMAFIFAGLAIIGPDTVMGIYTDKENIRRAGIDYLRIIGYAYPLEVLSIGMGVLLRTTEQVKIPLYASIVSVLTNIVLNWIFIFGKLGAPAMGVRGAAIATLCSAIVNVALICILSKIKRHDFLFMIKEHYKWDTSSVALYLKKCFPILCNEFAMGISNLIINVVLGHQAAAGIAALAVFRTIEGLIIGFFSGFSSASSILVGKCVGSGLLDEAFERARRIVYMCQGCILCIVILLLGIHTPLLHMMSLSGESFRIGTGLLIIYGVACVIRMGNWTMNDTFRSSGDSVTGTVLEIVFMYVLVIPCLLLAAYKFKASFLVIFAMSYIDEPIRYIIMQYHLYSGKWIKPVTDVGKAKLAEFFEK